MFIQRGQLITFILMHQINRNRICTVRSPPVVSLGFKQVGACSEYVGLEGCNPSEVSQFIVEKEQCRRPKLRIPNRTSIWNRKKPFPTAFNRISRCWSKQIQIKPAPVSAQVCIRDMQFSIMQNWTDIGAKTKQSSLYMIIQIFVLILHVMVRYS